ncbi:MAG: MBL fold metallo-hydrolase [Lachnospiraceae bacterium]
MADYLRSRGVDRLDYVVCTHAHEDHCGGLDDIIEDFEIGTLFAPYTEFDSSGAFTRFEDTAAERGLYITVPPLGSVFTLGGAEFQFVGPVSDWGDDLNDSSLVLRVEYWRQRHTLHGRHLLRRAGRLRRAGGLRPQLRRT